MPFCIMDLSPSEDFLRRAIGLITCDHQLLAPHLFQARIHRSVDLLITSYLTVGFNNLLLRVSAGPNLAESIAIPEP